MSNKDTTCQYCGGTGNENLERKAGEPDHWRITYNAVLATIKACKEASGQHRGIDQFVNATQITHDAHGTDNTKPAPQSPSLPEGYSVRHVEGHGWIVTPPNRSEWVLFENTPGGDFMKDLLAAAPQESEPLPWLKVIDNELVTAHLGVAEAGDDYDTAKRKIDALIQWNIDIAITPDFNGGLSLQSVRTDDQELPALPDTFYNGYSDGSEPLYTAEQMHDYARAAIAQAQPVQQWRDIESAPIGEEIFVKSANFGDLSYAYGFHINRVKLLRKNPIRKNSWEARYVTPNPEDNFYDEYFDYLTEWRPVEQATKEAGNHE